MSEPRDEISGGREPPRDRPPRWLQLRTRSSADWMAGHRRLVAVLAVAALGSGLWAWQRAHPVPLSDSVHVRVDPSEYFLPGQFDDQGRSSLLMLLHVDVSAGVAGPVYLVGLDGGGIFVAGEHEVLGTSAKLTIAAQLSCDEWAGGQGVRARFVVGPGIGQAIDIPLETDRSSPLGAPVTAPCTRFEDTHPLRLTVFSSVLEPSDPVIRTTWTLVNRSALPITFADEVVTGGLESAPPLVPLPPTETTVLAAHGTATLSRSIAVDSCAGPLPLDPAAMIVSLTGTTQPVAGAESVLQIALPGLFVSQLARTAEDVCRGAPDLSGTQVTLMLHRAPPGKGGARLTVTGRVHLPGVWTVSLGDVSVVDSEPQPAVGRTVQHLQGPAPFALSAGWVVHTCNSAVAAPADNSVNIAVMVSGLRTYPYMLPITILGRTSCTPGDVRN